MGKSKKARQHTSKRSTDTGSWLLPAQTTNLSGTVYAAVMLRNTRRRAICWTWQCAYVLVQILAIATTYIRKQVCLR